MGYAVSDEGPEDGHTFRITITSRMSSAVEGEPGYHDAEEFYPHPWTMEVRAWNLRDALHKAAARPLHTWQGRQ